MSLLDMVWPALYVSETFWRFWFIVVGTIVIELFVIKYFLKFSWKKSFFVSLIGNCVSGFAGTFVMTFAMLFWHLIVDNFVNGTFNTFNWIATYVLMCLGSVFIETKTISLIYKVKFRLLFVPMSIGNLLSYVFIAIIMLSSAKADEHVRTDKINYVFDTNQIKLLDKTWLNIDTAYIEIWYNKANERIDNAKPKYRLQIPFSKTKQDEFTVDFRLLNDDSGGGIYNNRSQLFVDQIKNEYKLVLEQKNPDTSYGWRKPIITDTLTLRRIKK